MLRRRQRLTPAQRRMCEVILREIPEYAKIKEGAPLRLQGYAVTVLYGIVAIMSTEIVAEISGSLVIFSGFFAVTALTLRRYGPGPAWLSIIIATLAVAYYLPGPGFGVDNKMAPRFVGVFLGLCCIMLTRPGSFTPPSPHQLSRSIRAIIETIKEYASLSSSLIGRPDLSASNKTS